LLFSVPFVARIARDAPRQSAATSYRCRRHQRAFRERAEGPARRARDSPDREKLGLSRIARERRSERASGRRRRSVGRRRAARVCPDGSCRFSRLCRSVVRRGAHGGNGRGDGHPRDGARAPGCRRVREAPVSRAWPTSPRRCAPPDARALSTTIDASDTSVWPRTIPSATRVLSGRSAARVCLRGRPRGTCGAVWAACWEAGATTGTRNPPLEVTGAMEETDRGKRMVTGRKRSPLASACASRCGASTPTGTGP
jgi:hypothetical protein